MNKLHEGAVERISRLLRQSLKNEFRAQEENRPEYEACRRKTDELRYVLCVLKGVETSDEETAAIH